MTRLAEVCCRKTVHRPSSTWALARTSLTCSVMSCKPWPAVASESRWIICGRITDWRFGDLAISRSGDCSEQISPMFKSADREATGDFAIWRLFHTDELRSSCRPMNKSPDHQISKSPNPLSVDNFPILEITGDLRC